MTKVELPLRLSVWSGPRNISTAMMRSFGSRSDCHPVDEPFYACYLTQTGLQHPMREEIIASQPSNWKTVISEINGALPHKKSILYLKHMTQHMLSDIKLEGLADHTHCFLIRDPRLVIASFSEKMDRVSADATGFKRQLELYRYFSKHAAKRPVVIEGEDIQKNPGEMLEHLCEACNLPFDKAMLSWKAGPHPEDGIWGAHWYNAVEKSTGFAAYSEKQVLLSDEQEQLAKELEPYYQELKAHKLTR